MKSYETQQGCRKARCLLWECGDIGYTCEMGKDRSYSDDNPICKTEKETQMYRTDFWTLWEKVRVGWPERIASKHVYHQVWNRSPAQVGCMRQVLRAGALGRPWGMGWGGRWEGRSGWGTHVNPWLIHVNVWQKPLQYCKVISLQLKKIIIIIKRNYSDHKAPKRENNHAIIPYLPVYPPYQ